MDTQDKIVKLTVYGIVRYRNRVLLLHRIEDIDVWEFPGGGIEFGEDPKNAAIREAWEETGIDVKDANIFDVSSVVYPDGKTMQVAIFYLMKLSRKPTVKLSSEHKEYEWVRVEDMNKPNLALSVKSIIDRLREKVRRK